MFRSDIPKIRQHSIYTIWFRLYHFIRGKYSNVIVKQKGVKIIVIKDRKYKRICFKDTHLASISERLLVDHDNSNYFPKVFMRHQSELWVTFIPGDHVKFPNTSFVDHVAKFYAYLYAHHPVLVSSNKYVKELERNLEFLNYIGVLRKDLYQSLLELKDEHYIETVWEGEEYTDSILKNFVLNEEDNTFAAIDVESLQANKMLGIGLAKADMKWMSEENLKYILNYMKNSDIPEFHKYYGFIRLYYRSKWLKGIYLRGKWKKLDCKILEELL